MRLSQLATRAAGPAIIASLLVVAACWMFVVPPGAGADEPGHLVRAGAVIRGDWSGDVVGEASLEAHVLPDDYVVPDTCHAFRSDVPVSCAPPVERRGDDVVLTTRADEYQVWPHLVYGLPTLLPGPAAVWWARSIGVTVVVALVGGALVVAGRERSRAGIVVALTPMAFGTFATVNPSTFAIAGGVAVWVAAASRPPWSRAVGWLLAGGWAAMSLSRRDGLIWAVLVIVVLQLSSGWSIVDRWRAMAWGPRTAIAATTLATVAWGVTSDSRVSQLVALSPLVLVAGELLRSAWMRWTDPAQRVATAASVSLLVVATTGLALSRRPGGWDPDLARAVVGQTGVHLVEAIGVLGWLDTPLPWLVVAGWIVVVGLLGAGALAEESRRPLVACAVVALALVTSWVFELLHGNSSGRYWQGRYSLPLLVGVPILLATASRNRVVTRVAGIAALVLLNAGLWAAARRWGVGLQGSLRPWEWDTPHTPLPTVALLVIHAVGSVVLALAIADRRSVTPSA